MMTGGIAAKVLEGANPAELPVQAPANDELVINLETAKALGLARERPLADIDSFCHWSADPGHREHQQAVQVVTMRARKGVLSVIDICFCDEVRAGNTARYFERLACRRAFGLGAVIDRRPHILRSCS